MEGAEKGEKKGVVWPRPTGLVVSAIMQLLEVFWFRRDVRKGGGASLTVTQHYAVGQDGGGETQKREATRRGKIYRMEKWGEDFSSFLEHGLPVCHIVPLC